MQVHGEVSSPYRRILGPLSTLPLSLPGAGQGGLWSVISSSSGWSLGPPSVASGEVPNSHQSGWGGPGRWAPCFMNVRAKPSFSSASTFKKYLKDGENVSF